MLSVVYKIHPDPAASCGFFLYGPLCGSDFLKTIPSRICKRKSGLTWAWVHAAGSQCQRFGFQTQSDGVVASMTENLPLLSPFATRHRTLQVQLRHTHTHTYTQTSEYAETKQKHELFIAGVSNAKTFHSSLTPVFKITSFIYII